MMKSLHELGQNLIKDVSETSMAILMLSGEDRMLSPHIGNKARSSPLLNIILEVLARAISKKEIKGIQIVKEEVKLSPFMYDKI